MIKRTESEWNIVVVSDHSSVTLKYKISDLESDIIASTLLHIHRSFVVNLDRITSFTSNEIVIGDKTLPIGSNYKEYVLRKLKS